MIEIRMPRLGVTMEAGTISAWLFEEGDFVEKGDYLFELESDKTTMEIEAVESGVLKKILVPEGKEVPVNTVLAIIGEEDEEIDLTPYLAQDAKDDRLDESAAAAEEVVPKEDSRSKAWKASPRAKKLAKELGISLETIVGTGKGGLITEEDVRNAHSRPDGPRVKESVPLNHVKRSMAANMAQSWTAIPHFTQIVSVNMANALKCKQEIGDITINDLLLKTIANVVRKNLHVNSRLENNNITIFEDINLSVAVDSEQGLVVPVIKEADKKSVHEISREMKSLAEKARNNELVLSDLEGGTITVSNLGSFGIESGTPIINSPQSTIIFAGKIVKTPVVNEEDEVVIEPVMKLTIAYDHRFIDGVEGAKFTTALKSALENLSINDLLN